MMGMTNDQKNLARHALGLPNKRHQSYRNRFVTGTGSDDWGAWDDMVAKGFAWRRKGSPLTGGDDLFRLTREGATAALIPGEKLCPEDFPNTPQVRAVKADGHRRK